MGVANCRRPDRFESKAVSVHHIHIDEVQQGAAGGSYVCIFDATVTLRTGGGSSVAVTGVQPSDAPADLVQQAAEWIRASATEVFEGVGYAASVAITRLIVNECDWKETRFKLYAAREFRKVLVAATSGGSRPLSA